MALNWSQEQDDVLGMLDLAKDLDERGLVLEGQKLAAFLARYSSLIINGREPDPPRSKVFQPTEKKPGDIVI